MIRLPEDIENELQKKYPNVHIQTLVQHIFQAILDKTLKDSSCHIREFGKFLAYSTISSKLGRSVVRFKFKLSTTLDSKIKVDDYFLNNVPAKAINVFADQHEEAVKGKRDQSKANIIAQKEAERFGKEKTKSNIQNDEVSNIIGNLFKDK